MSRVAIRTAWVCAAGLALACTTAVFAQAGPPAQGLVPGGPPPDAFLLYTGDVIGYVDPCG